MVTSRANFWQGGGRRGRGRRGACRDKCRHRRLKGGGEGAVTRQAGGSNNQRGNHIYFVDSQRLYLVINMSTRSDIFDRPAYDNHLVQQSFRDVYFIFYSVLDERCHRPSMSSARGAA